MCFLTCADNFFLNIKCFFEYDLFVVSELNCTLSGLAFLGLGTGLERLQQERFSRFL